MQEGQYVRTIYGIKRIDQIICGQDVRFDNTDGFDEFLLNYHYCDGISMNSSTWKEIVIGEPKDNIIDLIEVGDFIGKIKVEKIHSFDDCGRIIVMEDGFDEYDENDCFLEAGIVTKEQFERMEYKI